VAPRASRRLRRGLRGVPAIGHAGPDRPDPKTSPMRQLRGSDARLVYADDGYTTAHVTLIHIYDPSTAPDGKVRFKHILAQIEGRLHRSPVFRQKLLRVPLELDLPYWTDDERFDLEYHVRHIALPSPGDWRQFCIQASRIHARPLDLSRPLWEVHVIERLDGLLGLPRGSFALLTKIHQAAIDLDAGAELTTVLHDATPGPLPVTPAQPWFPESAPSALRLLKRGAQVRVSVRRVWISFSESFPAQRLFLQALRNIQGAMAQPAAP